MGILKQSHSAEKGKRGDLLGFLKLQCVAKYQKNLNEGPFRGKKLEKSCTMPKKIDRWTLQTRPILQMHEKVSG